MRVVAWNVAHNGEGAWAKLDSLDADVALLTEAVVLPGRSGVWHDRTEGRDGRTRPWSAAVVSPHPVKRIAMRVPRGAAGQGRCRSSAPGLAHGSPPRWSTLTSAR